jgi:hypothetical protein
MVLSLHQEVMLTVFVLMVFSCARLAQLTRFGCIFEFTDDRHNGANVATNYGR